MKRFINQSMLMLTIAGLFFTACKKEVASENLQPQQSDEVLMKSKAENELAEGRAAVAAFERELGGDMTRAMAASERNRNPRTIVDIASSLPVFKSLVAAVVKTGLAPTLSSASVNLTVFAPTDNAFGKLPAPFNNPANINSITDPQQIEALKNILLFHVIGTEVKRSQIAQGRSSVASLKPVVLANDNQLYISNQFGLLAVNGSSLVLLPDVDASNGVLHVIDDVLIPPTKTIAEIAIGNANLSTLVAALVKTNLAGVFTGAGNFTVFAPTNAAFSRLPAPFNNAANISAISNQQQIDALANILKYHVTDTRYFSLDLGILSPIATLASAPNNRIVGILGLNSGAVKGNSNQSFSIGYPVNILATNGVAHVINQVLLP